MSLRARLFLALCAHAAAVLTLTGLWMGPGSIPAVLVVALISPVGAWFLSGWLAEWLAGAAARRAAFLEAAARGQTPEAYQDRHPPELESLSRAASRAAEALARLAGERARFETLIEASSDGIVAVDSAEQVAFLNAAASRLFGADRDAATGRTLLELVRDHDIRDLVREALSLREQRQRVAPLGPSQRWLQMTVVPLEAQDEWAGLVVFTDVTEVRRLERVRRDFVSNVSHELRTPLAGIRAASETLAEGAIDDPEAAREFVGHIQSEADRLSQLVDELLELSRIESGEAPLHLEQTPVVQMLEGLAGRMGALASRAGLRIEVDAPADLAVRADRERLGQALANLVHNAVRFTPAGGVIRLSARGDDGHVIIEVADTGAGIREEDLPRIFERFYKADRGRASPGTGLGLAIVKHIAFAHGGTVSVASKPGQGSTFTLHLPASPNG